MPVPTDLSHGGARPAPPPRRTGPTIGRSGDLAYPAALLGLFALLWLALAVAPWYRDDWLLENALVFVALPVLAATARRQRFSNFAYTMLFVFLCLHEIGAHYTYSMVPYDQAFQALTGHSLNAALGIERNHYDRLVHFSFGLLLVPAAAELLADRAGLRGAWAVVLPVLVIEALSAIFELIEWAAATVFGGDLGQAYLGTQGDVWDAQSDMALALLGASIMQVLRTASRRRESAPSRFPDSPPQPAALLSRSTDRR